MHVHRADRVRDRDVVAGIAHAAAKIEILDMQEIPLVEAGDRVEDATRQEEACEDTHDPRME